MGRTDEKGRRDVIQLDQDLAMLRSTMAKHRPTLVIVDPIAYLGHIKTSADTEVRCLMPLKFRRVWRDHPLDASQQANDQSPLHRVSGSIGFTATVRAAYNVARIDDERRLFAPVKLNLGREPLGLEYAIKTTTGIERPLARTLVRVHSQVALDHRDRCSEGRGGVLVARALAPGGVERVKWSGSRRRGSRNRP